MEVLSASSVDGSSSTATATTGSSASSPGCSSALPVAFVATRLPHKALRALAWPALLLAVVLLALTQTGLGVEVNGNRNWLALGPVVVQPAEVAKLAVILWCADVYARKERLLDDWQHTLIPVAPVMAMVVGLVLLGGDLGTALVLMAIILGMLWVVGAPARLFVGSMVTVGVSRALPRQHQQGAPGPADQLRRPVQGLPGRRLAVRPRPLRDVQRRPVRQGHRRQPAEVGQPARGAHRLHLRRARRGAGPGRHAPGARALPDHRLRRHPGRAAHPGPVRALHVRRHHRLADRADDDQRRHGAGAAAGHRHPAAARLLRRLRAAALAGGARPARLVRPCRARGRRPRSPPPRRRRGRWRSRRRVRSAA